MQLIPLTENSVMPYVQPKATDLIKMIGEENLKRETSFAIQAANANSYLSQATPQSVAKAIWNVAITKLTLNPIHALAYLTPRRIGQSVEAILMPSYRGIVKLLTDTGSIKNAYAHVVYEGDEFEVLLGVEYTLKHKPMFKSSKITHVYAVGVLHDDTKQFEVMSVEEINLIRERSDGYRAFKSGKAQTAIWESDYGEMARKTVIKRLAKYLPKTDRWDEVNQAISIDNEEYQSTIGQDSYILSLVETSTYEHDKRHSIVKHVESGITSDEAEAYIKDLQNNQLNKLQAGIAMNASETSKEVNNAIENK